MGQLDTLSEDNYETRELAWELQQPHPDQQRIRFLLENEADLRAAMRMAQVEERDLTRKPAFKAMHLERILHAPA